MKRKLLIVLTLVVVLLVALLIRKSIIPSKYKYPYGFKQLPSSGLLKGYDPYWVPTQPRKNK